MPNNREWALLIWIAIFLLWVLSRKDLRSSSGDVVRAAAHPKILIPFGCMLGYISLELWIGHRLSLWHRDLTTDIVTWIIVSAMALFINPEDASTKPHFFRRRTLATLGITEFLQFFTSLFVLSLIAEFFLQPFLAVLAMLAVVAGMDDQYKSVKKLVNGLLALIGLGLLAFSIDQVVVHWATIDWYGLLRKFGLPIWLTVGLLPFIYVLSLYANYDKAFTFINVATTDRKARLRAKLALVSQLHVRSRDSHDFGGPWLERIASAPNLTAARHVVAEFQRSQRAAERAVIEEQDRLRRYAGSDETDAEGRRLDRREFKETIKALRWLATCEMGWYHNRDRGRRLRYRADLLTALGNDFTTHGLPRESGITLKVAKDGQAWYAWRRTITGWCFAIGAAGPPPDQWEYDGPEPPQGFPRKDPRWGEGPFSNEANPNWVPDE